MSRVIFFFALLVAAASAFVAPGNSRVALVRPSVEAPKMIPAEVVGELSTFAANGANLIASTEKDFGGYLFPVFGLGSLAGLILFLAPPLKDD
mmetsp:Transcript_42953/g.62951  ORF Transcript_42953/g.62951 Transcript_42953/m.62951 type:complete len:93 (-) Transcript_42953:248-526(-)